MAATSSHPVVLIHGAPWCGACKQLLQRENLDKLTKTVKAINPNTTIKVIYHKNFKETNKTDEYPPINAFSEFPTIMVTSSSNCSKRGSMSKVEVFKYKWNGSSLVRSQTQEDYGAFFTRAINSVMGTPVPPRQPNGHTVPHNSTPVTVSGAVKTERTARHFRLVGLNE
jgi:hypothetical protein